jgi:hypothetical protein
MIIEETNQDQLDLREELKKFTGTNERNKIFVGKGHLSTSIGLTEGAMFFISKTHSMGLLNVLVDCLVDLQGAGNVQRLILKVISNSPQIGVEVFGDTPRNKLWDRELGHEQREFMVIPDGEWIFYYQRGILFLPSESSGL